MKTISVFCSCIGYLLPACVGWD